MTTLNEQLRDADPVTHEPDLTVEERDRIRRAMLAEPARRPLAWTGSLVLAGALIVMFAIAVGQSGDENPPRDGTTAPAATARERRQLQFATPGGTRVIWVFDSTFDLK